MKRKINIIAVALMLAISSFIGIGKVRGEDEIDSTSGVNEGTSYTPGEGECLNKYHYCFSTAAQSVYYIIEVYDTVYNKSTYYYDLNLSGSGGYTEGNFSLAIGNKEKPIYKIDIASTFFDNSFKRNDPAKWGWTTKWNNLFNDFKTTLSDGSQQIKSNKFNNWLYINRAGARYSNLKDATADLKKYGQLYIVRISAGIIMYNRNGSGGNVSGRPLVAIDRIFNPDGAIDPDRNQKNIIVNNGIKYIQGDMNYFNDDLKLGSSNGSSSCCDDASGRYGSYNCQYKCNDEINQKYKICTYASSRVDICGYDRNTGTGGFLDNTAWFTDYGRGIEPEPEDQCETLCKKSEVKNGWKYTDLPNGMTTEEACVSCCENGKINLNLGSCKYKPNECIYTPPTPIGEQPSDNQLTCNTTTTISSKTLTGEVIANQCGGVPIYASVNGAINVDDLRTFYDGTLAKLLVAGKGFNWNLLFSGIIQVQRSIDKAGYLNSYNIYRTCLKNKIDAGVATNEEKAEYDKYNTCYNDLYNYNENNLQSETLNVSDLLTATDKQMNINGYGTQNANQYDAIYKNSGDPFNTHTVDANKDFVYTYTEFFVPITVQNGTKGDLIAKVNSNSSVFQLQNNEVKCPIVVSSYTECQDDDKCLDDDDNDNDNDNDDDDDCDYPNDPDCPPFTCDDPNGCTTGLNLIYRPISLKDPFPNRTEGYNWKGYTDLITNNRNVSDNEVYRQEPMYVITLTPTDIKEIREYNKTHSYNDFDLSCDEYGLQCRSEFIKTTYRNLFESGTCGLDGDWYACYTQSQEDIVEAILSPMKYKKEGE